MHAFSSRSDPIIPQKKSTNELYFRIYKFTNEINNLCVFQKGLGFKEIAEAQESDVFIQFFLEGASTSSLKLEEIKMDNSDQILLYDVSTSIVRPIIVEKYRKLIFDKVHGTSHPGI